MSNVHRVLAAALSAALVASPAAMARGTGNLFVSSEKDHSVTVLDGKTYAVIERIATASRPRHLRFSPDRSRIYVACGDGNAIDIIDVASMKLVDRIGPIDDPEVFEFGPHGNTLYISLEDDAKLGILDLETYFAERSGMPELVVGEVSEEENERDEEEEEEEEGDGDGEAQLLPGMTTVEVGEEPEGILVSPDGKTVYVASEAANVVHVVDTESRELEANVVVGKRPRRFALTPDRKELWVSNELGASVTIVDAVANKVIETVEFKPKGFRPEDVTPVGIAMTGDGKTAFVTLGRANHVAVVDVASRDVERYILVGKRAWNASLSADESTLFVVNGLSDDVSIIDVGRMRVRKSVPTPRVPYAVLIDD